jgi:hypothetical protein
MTRCYERNNVPRNIVRSNHDELGLEDHLSKMRDLVEMVEE